MSLRVPSVEYRSVDEGHPGYYVGLALDELVDYARREGASEEELRERLEESFERFDQEDR